MRAEARWNIRRRTKVGLSMTMNRIAILLAATSIATLLGCSPSDPPGRGSANAAEPAPSNTGRAMKPILSKSGYDITPLSHEQVAKLAAKLTPEQFRVTQ